VYPDKTAMDANDIGGWVISDRVADAAGSDFQLLYRKSDSSWRSFVYNVAGAGEGFAGVNSASNAVWQHVVMVVGYDSGSKIALFVNGGIVTNVALSITPANANTNRAAIGQLSSNLGEGNTKYHGHIDKVRFYSTAKDADFVKAIYDAEKASKGK
jgi:hypothetical protein